MTTVSHNPTAGAFTGCWACGSGELRYSRAQLPDGSRRLRASCRRSGADAGSPPSGRGFEALAERDRQQTITAFARCCDEEIGR